MATTLEEALRQGRVKIGDYIDYKPISGRCVLRTKQTGWQKDQVFKTENLGWRLDNIGGILVLIASRPTKKLSLKGKTGYNNGIEAMKTLCESCYSNLQFSQKAVTITKELQRKMSKCNIISAFYWLGSSWPINGCTDAYYGIGYVRKDGIYANVRSYDGTGCRYYGVRPVVYLKPEILLGEGLGTKENPWKILLPQVPSGAMQ